MAIAKHFNSYKLETGILTKYIIGPHSNPLLNCLNNKRLNFNFNKKSQLLKLIVEWHRDYHVNRVLQRYVDARLHTYLIS